MFLVHVEEISEESANPGEMLAGQEPKKEKVKKRKAKKAEEAAESLPEEPKQTFGTIEIRPIEVSYATPDAIEIKEGLEEGDLVTVDVEQEIQDKARVEISETQEGLF